MRWVGLTILMVVLVGCTAGIDVQTIMDENPDALVTMNKLSGDRAELFLASLKEFCEVETQDVYRVQLTTEEKTLAKVFDTSGNMICEVDTSDPDYARKSIAITVNGEPIFLAEVQTVLGSLPQEVQGESVVSVVNNMIDQKLLLQQAVTQRLTITDAELASALSQVVSQNELNPTQQELESLRGALKDQMLTQAMLSKIIDDSEIIVTENEARGYYANNKERLILPESWSIRHIQININSEDPQTSKGKADTVMSLVDSENFCDLVKQFTDDETSRNNCGRYTFTIGQMNPAIAQAVQGMETGKPELVSAPVSHHVLELISKNPARQAEYLELKDAIISQLMQEKRQQTVQDYLANLRQDSYIVSYLG